MTQNTSDKQLDLNSLVASANRQVGQANDKARQSATGAPKSGMSRLVLTVAMAAGLLVLLYIQAGDLRRFLFGVSQAAIHAQAETILSTARAAVEDHHKLTGKLPDRVPLAALDALVTLQSDGTGYQLNLSLDGKTWRMDQAGTISGEGK